MLVRGRWHTFDDGIVRPVVEARVETPAGDWKTVRLLLDAGADRTVFDARFLSLLSPFALPESQAQQLGGVGGKAECLFVQTRLAFTRADGKRVIVQGPLGVFTDPASSDVSVLGRDVTNNFDVIYSHPQRQVLILAAPHRYQVLPPG